MSRVPQCAKTPALTPPPQKKPREVLRAHAVSLRDVYTFALIPGATRCPWERGGVQLVTSMLHVPAEQVLEKEQSSIRLSLSASRRGRGSPHPHPHRVPGLQFSQSGESHRVEFATAKRRQQPTCASAGGGQTGRGAHAQGRSSARPSERGSSDARCPAARQRAAPRGPRGGHARTDGECGGAGARRRGLAVHGAQGFSSWRRRDWPHNGGRAELCA